MRKKREEVQRKRQVARRRSTVRLGVTGLGERQELASGIYINMKYRGCTPGFVHTEEGIVLIDAPLIPQQAIDWRKQIEELYPESPLLYMINTDHHRGHALGNQYFMPIQVIAHERAHKEMAGYTDNFKERVRNSFKREPEIQDQLNDIEIIPPHVTYTEGASLLYGTREIEIIYVGGHTSATSIVWLPAEKLCFVGDIVWADQHPYMAQGNTIEWLEALELIRNLGAEQLVPGHGPVCTPDDTYRVGEYIHFIRGRVLDFYKEGKNKNETKSGLVGEVLEWFPVPPERKAKIESQIKSGINRVYREIQREQEELEGILAENDAESEEDADEDDNSTPAEAAEVAAVAEAEDTE